MGYPLLFFPLVDFLVHNKFFQSLPDESVGSKLEWLLWVVVGYFLRLIQSVNPKAWVHLFRETVGAEIVRADPSLLSIYKVMMRLDLESEQTAWRYIRRYHIDLIK
jgi:hypothetical protein